MKVILNEDVKYLGEEGDVKTVAAGYARNYLLPRGLVVPYNDETAAMFDARKAEIEKRKEVKRQNARSTKEKLEDTKFEIQMPSGANGKLYGAVTANILVDTLAKNGFEIEKKRIEMPGTAVKSVGTYHATIKLYESQTAEITFVVMAHVSEEEKALAAQRAKKEKTDKENAENGIGNESKPQHAPMDPIEADEM